MLMTRISLSLRFLQPRKKSNELFNQLSIVGFAALLILTPLYPFKRMVFLIGFLLAWILSTITIDARWIKRSQKAILFLLVFFAMDLLYAVSNWNLQLLKTFFTQKIFVYIWLLVLIFYIRHVNLLGFPIIAILIMIFITCTFTISGNLTVPGASRRLAAGGERAMAYHNLNVAGYDIIYGLVFMPLPLIVAIRKKTLHPVIAIGMIVLIFATLVIASYTLSILLCLGIVISTIANPKNKWKFCGSMLLLTAVLLIFRKDISNIVINIGNKIGSYMLVRRATQIRDMTYFSDYGYSEYNRLILYRNGLMNFVRHPFFGKMGGAYLGLLNAGHSGFINYFETYGLFGCIYVLYWRYAYRITKRCMMSEETQTNYPILFTFLMVFILTDTIDVAGATTLCAIFVCPSMLMYSDYLSRKVMIQKKNMNERHE